MRVIPTCGYVYVCRYGLQCYLLSFRSQLHNIKFLHDPDDDDPLKRGILSIIVAVLLAEEVCLQQPSCFCHVPCANISENYFYRYNEIHKIFQILDKIHSFSYYIV